MASPAFHRAVEALERAHRLSLILLVGPNDRAGEAREQLDKLLPPPLQVHSYRIDRQGPDMLSFAEPLADPFPILFVHGFERLHPAQREDVEIRLNLLRDAFAQHHLGLVFWLPRDALESFLQHCPDLFAWRSLLAEVADSELSVPPNVAARREYLSGMLRQTRLPELPMEVQVTAADRASSPIDFRDWAMKLGLGLVVGPVGSGKTTALRALAHRLADQAYDDPAQPLPVLLHGGTLSPYSRFETDRFWPRGLKPELSPEELSRLAEAGQLIVLLDGLDEVPPVIRKSLHNWIVHLSNEYPLLKIIIATRTLESGLFTGSSREWETVRVQEVARAQPRDLALESLQLDGTVSEGRRGLALFRVRFLGNLVDRRLMDFDETTSRYRGVGHAQRLDVLSYRELRRGLQRMALAAMTAGTTWISGDKLLSVLSDTSGPFSTEAVRENAEYLLVSRSGLLQEEAGHLSFAHKSLQEYLAAEGMAALGVEPALDTLKAHVADVHWSKVVAYTVALLETRSSTGGKLLDALADHALSIPEAGPRAASFATVLGAAVGVDIWSDTLAAVLRAARSMLEDPGDASPALEPVVADAMRLHVTVE